MEKEKWLKLIDHQIKLSMSNGLKFPEDFNEKEQLKKQLDMALKLLVELG